MTKILLANFSSRHTIDDWHEPASQRISQDRQQDLIPGFAESQASFDGGAFTHQAVRQHVEAQAYPCQADLVRSSRIRR
jgi:hypothetical protein